MNKDKGSKLISCTFHGHEHNLSQQIQTLRTNCHFFDVTLVAEGKAVPAHKLVLASCSDYFRVMFTGDMQESREDRIELKEITDEILTSLIGFAYTGKLDLSMDNIEEVVSAAGYFQMANAVEVCATFLKKSLRMENCVDILNLAETYALKRIYRETEKFLLDRFHNIPEEYLLKLSAKQLMGLLSKNSLLVDSEYKLFEKVVTWIEKTTDVTEDIAFKILSKIRLPLVTEKELSRGGERKVMRSYSRCQELLSEALEYHKDVLKQPLMQNERTQIRAEQKSYIISSENHFEIINDYQNYCESLYGPLYGPVEAHGFQLNDIVVVDNFLYASFDQEYNRGSNSFYRYDPRFEVWSKLSTSTMKWYLSMVLVPYKKKIYAVDGGNETSLQLEVFSIENNKWETKASVQNRNRWFAGYAFQDKIYISGGEDSEKSDHQVYCYTPSSDTWETKAPMIKARKDHKMAEINKKLYAFGGDASNSVEYYLPGDDQWILCEEILRFEVFGLFEGKEGIFLLRKDWSDDEHSPFEDPEGVAFEHYDPDTEETCFVKHSSYTLRVYDKIMCESLTIRRKIPRYTFEESDSSVEDDTSEG